jgi:hypothetical protein
MAILPSKLQDFLDWSDLHAATWTANAAQIGITAAKAAAFNEFAQTARERYNQQLAARQALENATELQQDAVRDARRAAADLIRDIKAYAEDQPKPTEIYVLADLPVPGTAAPLPPPGKPNSVTVGIEPASGAITLKWKVANPAGASGTTYIVRRRVGSTGEYAFVGISGFKEFTDNTFIAGPDSVQYTIQGQRGPTAGLTSDPITINFGRQGPGRSSVSVEGAEIERQDVREVA